MKKEQLPLYALALAVLVVGLLLPGFPWEPWSACRSCWPAR